MTKLQQIMITMNSFSMGIMIPVLNLILLERGATIKTLPLLLAIYSATVLLLELPSGICADLFGRKTVYLLSCILHSISFSLLLLANNMIWLITAMIFYGLGRAFSSGSLDASFIDDAIVRKGVDCLAKVTSKMAMLESIGLAVGGIVGGILSEITGTFFFNLVLRVLFSLSLLLLCLIFVKEESSMHNNKVRTPLFTHIRQSKQVVFSTPRLGLIFLGVLFTGFWLSSIETYWQPAFMQFSNGDSVTWMLGFILSLGFLSVIFGNIIAQKLLDRFSNHWLGIYNIGRLTLAVSISIFAFQKGFGFVIWYLITYLLLGISNVAESTLINKMTPNHMRASILSFNSLLIQIGGFCASIFSSFMISGLKFSGIWIVSGILIGGYTVVSLLIIYNKHLIKAIFSP